jgi:hypothetical protein
MYNVMLIHKKLLKFQRSSPAFMFRSRMPKKTLKMQTGSSSEISGNYLPMNMV